MQKIAAYTRKIIDIREGEHGRTLFMTLYLMSVLFAYYILKPVSRAMFLSEFKIDRLPYLYILIAAVGGVIAYLYSKMAVQTSLSKAVTWSTIITTASVVVLWLLLQLELPWMLYVFNIWVSLFGVVVVSQAWLLAANIFNPREAKRLYGILGTGAILGAAFGGMFTTFTVRIVGTQNLVLACGVMILVAYGCFLGVKRQKGVSLAGAKAAEAEEAEFRIGDIFSAISRYRHLQVIIGIMLMTFIVDVMVEFQFQAAAKERFQNEEDLAAFFGSFFGLYLNIVSFFFQFVLTGLIVRWVGVGGTLLILPVSMAAASVLIFAVPGLLMTAIGRLTEAAMRYSFNRTGMELLYMPLPSELRNRTKAFVDIFVDRFGRGLGGVVLIAAGALLGSNLRLIALTIVIFAGIWIYLAIVARREYVDTVRKRLESRRLDLEDIRLRVSDPATVALLEQAAQSGQTRQAVYALSLLAEAPGYRFEPLLEKLGDSPLEEVRAKVFELARLRDQEGWEERARRELERGAEDASGLSAVQGAVQYLLRRPEESRELAASLIQHSSAGVVEAALASLSSWEGATEIITRDLIAEMSGDARAERRRLAAYALGVRGDQGIEALYQLIADADPEVARQGCLSAGRLQNRAYVPLLLQRLVDARVRGAAIEALSAFGNRITGTLSDTLYDADAPVAVRRQIPRVLSKTPTQASVDVLVRDLSEANLAVRASILRALGRLREKAPQLDYGTASVQKLVLEEARHYVELNAALEPFRAKTTPHTAAHLLARTIEERLEQTLERLFRLLGLCYPPREIYSAYLAMQRGKGEQQTAAVEFLDNVLERDVKRYTIPLLDSTDRLADVGRDLFRVEPKTTEAAVLELIRSQDPWLVACAIATAGELRLRRAKEEIVKASRKAGAEVQQVARAALATLQQEEGAPSYGRTQLS
jgi:ATP:ADP antiporter, AAA family